MEKQQYKPDKFEVFFRTLRMALIVGLLCYIASTKNFSFSFEIKKPLQNTSVQIEADTIKVK